MIQIQEGKIEVWKKHYGTCKINIDDERKALKLCKIKREKIQMLLARDEEKDIKVLKICHYDSNQKEVCEIGSILCDGKITNVWELMI